MTMFNHQYSLRRRVKHFIYAVVHAVLLNYSVKDLQNNTYNNKENPLFKLESLSEF